MKKKKRDAKIGRVEGKIKKNLICKESQKRWQDKCSNIL